MPFHHVMIRTNGDFNVCCRHDMKYSMNINTNTVEQWRDSEYMTEVRRSFLADQRHPGCNACWTKEDQGFVSLRQRTAREYEILKIDLDKMSVNNIEVDLTNLCNLKCLMCNEDNSSSILAENIQLGINVVDQKSIKWSEQGFKNLQDLLMQHPKIVSIRGGEPLYVKQLLELVENIPGEQAKSMALHITTNATVWNQRWQQALAKFRLVRLMFSIDAVGDLYEYLRYPAQWSSVVENIHNMRSMKNVQCLVHCVVHNLNLHALGDLITWCKDQSLWLNLDLIDQPKYLQVNNLDHAKKAQALEHLKHVSTLDLEPHIKQNIDNCIKSLENTEFESAQWQQFEKYVSMRDQIRGNDYRKFLN